MCDGYERVAGLARSAYDSWVSDANRYKLEPAHEPRAQEIIHLALAGVVHTLVPAVVAPESPFYHQEVRDGADEFQRFSKERLVRNRLPIKESSSDTDICIEIDEYVRPALLQLLGFESVHSINACSL